MILPSSWLRVALIDLKLDLRRFAVLLACIALGVATIATVGSIGAALSGAIARDARSLLGGDIEASIGYRRATADERAAMDRLGRVSEVIEVASRATAGTASALIALRAVDAAYPLVGQVTVVPGPGLGNLAQSLSATGGTFGALADPLLFDRLGVKPGDAIRIGSETYRLTGQLAGLPDQAARGFSIGATVLVAGGSLDATGILQPGTIARYRYKIDLGGGDPDRARSTLKLALTDPGWQIRSPREATAALTRSLDVFDRFLILVGLSSLLVGGIGVSNAAAAYIGERERSVAVFRSLGATSGRVMVHFLVQIMLLGAIGTIAGLVLGAVSTLVLLPILAGYLSIGLPPALYPVPLAGGAGFGLLIAFVFAYLPLLRAAALRPAVLFRAAGGLALQPFAWRSLRDWRRSGPLLVGVLLGLGLVLLTTREPMLLLWYGLGALGAFLVLRLASALLQRVIRRVPAGRSLVTRLALRNIHRPGAPTPTVILSLGLGLTLMLSIALVQSSIRGQLNGQLGASAPSFVLMNVDKPSAAAVTAFAHGDPGIASLSFTPLLRGIVTRLDGVKVGDRKDIDAATIARLGGDRSLSWRADLPAGDKVLEGKWWPADYKGPPLVSLDQDFAEPLHLKVGDSMEIAISGRPIAVTVANIRHVEWQNASLSFDILFSPGLIEAAPSTSMGALKAAPGQETAVQASLVANFPTVGFIPVSDVLAQVSSVVGALANAVAIVGGVALLSGIFVLAGALSAGRRQREADAVVVKVLGGTRREIALAFLIEYGLLGLLATLVAAGLGAAAGWAIVTRLMQLEFSFDVWLVGLVALGAMAATILTGLATTWSALASKPAAFLRAEE